MANGRNKLRKGDAGRESGGFVALPWSVLDSQAFQRLSHPARSLLLELARQFVRDNNGRLMASLAQLKSRGWSSNDTITRALRELQAAGFVFQTVQGQRPNKASWYAITWRNLDRHTGYDAGTWEGFQRGAYRQTEGLKNATLTPSDGAVKNASLTPSRGDIERPIAPPHGVDAQAVAPPDGAIRAIFRRRSTPPDGDHLEIPSTGSEATSPGALNDRPVVEPQVLRKSRWPGKSKKGEAGTQQVLVSRGFADAAQLVLPV